MKKIVKALIIVLFVLVLSSCSEKNLSNAGKVHIISIGESYEYTKYYNEQTGRYSYHVSPLTCCVEDARDFTKAMEQIYEAKGIECDAVTMVCEGENPDWSNPLVPTAQHIVDQLRALKVEKNDLIIFYYSGHGTVYNDPNNNNEETSCLVTAYLSGTDLFYQVMNDVEALEEIIASKGCMSIGIYDACKIGADYENGSGNSLGKLFSSIGKKIDISKNSVIASSAADQNSSAGTYNSTFTAALLEALGYDCTTNKEVSVPSYMTTKQLLKKTVKIMGLTNQNPEVNFTELDVVIVPR